MGREGRGVIVGQWGRDAGPFASYDGLLSYPKLWSSVNKPEMNSRGKEKEGAVKFWFSGLEVMRGCELAGKE